MIDSGQYVEFLGSEYLRGYVDTGGCAVKFTVADDSVASEFRDELANEGKQSGYLVATVDAKTTRVHLMEQIFFEVARQVDWDELAARAPRAPLPRRDSLHRRPMSRRSTISPRITRPMRAS